MSTTLTTKVAEKHASSRYYEPEVIYELIYEIFPPLDRSNGGNGHQKYYTRNTMDVIRHIDAYGERYPGLAEKAEKLKQSIDMDSDYAKELLNNSRIRVRKDFSPVRFNSAIKQIWNGDPAKYCSPYIHEVFE